MFFRYKFYFFIAFTFIFANVNAVQRTLSAQESSAKVFIRFKVKKPADQKFSVTVGGFRHAGEPWYFPNVAAEVMGEKWSDWIDLSGWQWHERQNRSGGLAEYPSVTLSVANIGAGEKNGGAALDVELADSPDEKGKVVSFTEQSASNVIGFLVPYPLRAGAKEFETGSQMVARQAAWAKEAVGGKPVKLNKFQIITNLWGPYDPALAEQSVATLKLLGFNVIGTYPSIVQKYGLETYQTTGLYEADPNILETEWAKVANQLKASAADSESPKTAFWEIADEVSGIEIRPVEAAKLNGWFQSYLKSENVTERDLGMPLDQVPYPTATMYEGTLPKNEPLEKRRQLYYAAKFSQWWSAKQLRQLTDLIQTTQPGMKTETLLPSHGFLGNAWGAANIGMSYRMLDIFELGAQKSVSRLNAEDWLGLNHMYGENYTWTGGQTFGYYNAIIRSAIADQPMSLGGLITPSDDKYLRLKAYSGLAQGEKSFFFWSYGPTYIGTENYWSDLRSEYDGISKLGRALEKSEDVIYPAKTVSDPVAILYSVSHDIWNTDNQAAFVEKRLLWHALRHLQIQPDFLREEAVEAGDLKNYKVLYITDWNISRRASEAIDKWVKQGGVLYLSGGAATRDEFNEPYSPPFSQVVSGDNAARRLVFEHSTFNERTVLPDIKPLTTVSVRIKNQQFNLPVIGTRLDLQPNKAAEFAAFSDGQTAGIEMAYGRGKIFGLGFMPMLTYGKLADFKPTTLEEKWQPEPRRIIAMPLDAAHLAPVVKADVPVVETALLTGSQGSAVILANYTYQPISPLTIDVKISAPVKKAVSVEGENVRMTRLSADRIRLKLPLKWTDIVILK